MLNKNLLKKLYFLKFIVWDITWRGNQSLSNIFARLFYVFLQFSTIAIAVGIFNTSKSINNINDLEVNSGYFLNFNVGYKNICTFNLYDKNHKKKFRIFYPTFNKYELENEYVKIWSKKNILANIDDIYQIQLVDSEKFVLKFTKEQLDRSKKINEKWTKFSIIFSFIFFIIILFCNRMTYIKGDYNGGSYRY